MIKCWWVTTNPKIWSWDMMYSNLNNEVFFYLGKFKENFENIKKGDFIFGYQSSPITKIVALAYVKKELHFNSTHDDDGIILKGIGDYLLDYPVNFGLIKPLIKESEPIRNNAQGTLFKLSDKESKIIFDLIVKAGNSIKFPKNLKRIEKLYNINSKQNISTSKIYKPKKTIKKNQSKNNNTKHRTSLYESNIETFIIERLENIEEGLKFQKRQFKTDAGIIDILCKDKNNKVVIIELKRKDSTDKVVGQILRYIGWAKEHYKTNDIRGIIIVGKKNKRLEYAVSSLSNVTLKEFKISIN